MTRENDERLVAGMMDNPPMSHSVPPNVTWPMVAYRLVKEIPQILIIAGATLVCFYFVKANPAAFGEAMLGFVSSALGAGLIRSRPSEDK